MMQLKYIKVETENLEQNKCAKLKEDILMNERSERKDKKYGF